MINNLIFNFNKNNKIIVYMIFNQIVMKTVNILWKISWLIKFVKFKM